MGAALALIVTGAVGLTVAAFPVATGTAFGGDAEVTAIAAGALRLIGPALPGLGVGMVFYFAAWALDA